ncbi:LysM peptidoglycan-binding domain-containing protein [Oceanimonas sp. CHS3-5]|uniref:LysM peptidoglycan-binding domain-containing protein n=1 Tax=Oceanimonas sp. CHS3-5 TaxID=3068186 RepID=UPI00273D6E01|nr:LysM peptidoglycan-binding domain-containing protein [Oceanimonas sp. CHS3-5]MDP5290756.1 LysM peptidoglycan-binding domain-containing protein [Oceanimonas sp. CHS3-5]
MIRLCLLSGALLLAGCQAVSTDSARQTHGHQNRAEEQTSQPYYSKSSDYASRKAAGRDSRHSSDEGPEQRKADARQQDMWQAIADDMTLDIPADHPRVVAQRKWYLKQPGYMRAVTERARPFLYLIKEEIEKRDMPMELVLLPVVESTFDPKAYSHSHAAGIWQMLKGTGKNFGLHYDSWYDGRYDIMASTDAALDYLEYLHKFFDGNWTHALAAYNSGEGRVQRAIRANRRHGKPTDFWSLSLPKETQNYVPKLMALADILKQPGHYGMDVPVLPNRPQVAAVTVEGQVDLNMAADLAGVSRSQLRELNPAFKHTATSPLIDTEILVPVRHAETFELAMADLPAEERMSYQRYRVKGGDSLGVIARRHGTHIVALKQANNLRGNTIRIGQTLLVPTSAAPAPARASTQQSTYRVRAGDSLSVIASRFSVSIADLLRWNRLSNKHMLRAGQKLIVAANSG